MLRNNPIRQRWAKGQPAVGTWVLTQDPMQMEMMSRLGFDWLLIDCEHMPIGPEALRNLVLAAEGSETAVLVRVGANQDALIKHALDTGTDGVLVPLVHTRDLAELAVAQSKYPPLGRRGFGPFRPSQYTADVPGYVACANDTLITAVQIESAQALANLDDILSVQGLDAVFVGPSDLSMNMGHDPMQLSPQVEEAIATVFRKAVAAGVPCGTISSTPEQCLRRIGQGATFMTLSADLHLLRDAAVGALSRVRDAASAPDGRPGSPNPT